MYMTCSHVGNIILLKNCSTSLFPPTHQHKERNLFMHIHSLYLRYIYGCGRSVMNTNKKNTLVSYAVIHLL